MTAAVIVGYGSIGARHARLLADMGVSITCVTRNGDCPYPVHASIADGLAAANPDLVVIANPTAQHAAALAELARLGFGGNVLVEKPLLGGAGTLPDLAGMSVHVAYNLRFHPLVMQLKQHMESARIISASFRAGQYLPDWRPGSDYTKGYSASRAGGGGVLRDLSHELDLAIWFGGTWSRVASVITQSGLLDIETEDAATLLLQFDQGAAVTVAVDYLRPKPHRSIDIVAERNGSVIQGSLDLIEGRLILGADETVAPSARDVTYRGQLEAILGETGTACTLPEALEVESLIAAAEEASTRGGWVTRS